MYLTVSERRIRKNQQRRRRELHRNFTLALFTITLILTCSVVFFSVKTRAQEKENVVLYKYYKSVVVEYGDTIWDYAKEYAVPEQYHSKQSYIDEVCRMNALADEQITSGQHLLLPYYSSEFIE